MIACYLELYEEGEAKHINRPTHLFPGHGFVFIGRSETTQLGSSFLHIQKPFPVHIV